MVGFYEGVLISVICLTIGLVVTCSNTSVQRKVILSLALTFLGISSYRVINENQSRAVPAVSYNQEVLVLSMRVDKANNAIYLWISDGELGPVTYKMPYSEELKKKVEGFRSKYNGKPFGAKIRVQKGARYDDIRNVDIQDNIRRYPVKQRRQVQ